MPPNRKHVITPELPIATGSMRKFLPLTDPREEHFHTQEQKTRAESFDDELSAYWDWPVDTKCNDEESFNRLFSTAHIEANLIQDAKNKHEPTPSRQAASHDDYWFTSNASEEMVFSSRPQHDAYWHFPANRVLYKEQEAERLTSTTHIESNLRTFAVTAAPASCSTNEKNEYHRYWDWSSADSQPQRNSQTTQVDSADYWEWKTLSKEEDKREFIKQILLYEAARQLLSAEHMEMRLAKAAPSADRSTVIVAAPSSTLSIGYWDW